MAETLEKFDTNQIYENMVELRKMCTEIAPIKIPPQNFWNILWNGLINFHTNDNNK